MARIKYTGPADPVRIPGVGVVSIKDEKNRPAWVECPAGIAREFKAVEHFEVELGAKPGEENTKSKSTGAAPSGVGGKKIRR